MAEEHRCQAPKLCVNNCGFFGSQATQGLCSKCHRDLQLKEQQSSSAKFALNQTLISSSLLNINSPSSSLDQPPVIVDDKAESSVAAAEEVVVLPSRCMTCRKRVGITGFKCRCGKMFCGSHRYPEHHGCEFDFKGLGKEQIAKANPVVKGEKLQKI